MPEDKKPAKMAAEPERLPHRGSRLVRSFEQTITHMEYLTVQMRRAADSGTCIGLADGLMDDLALMQVTLKTYDQKMAEEYAANPNPLWRRESD